MNVIKYLESFMSKIDLSDEFEIRRTFEKSQVLLSACRLQYFKPDRIDDVIKKTEEDARIFILTDNQDEKDFDQYILACLNKVKQSKKKDLISDWMISILESELGDIVMMEIKRLGLARFNNKYQCDFHELFMQLEALVNMNLNRELKECIKDYPLSQTNFSQYALQEYDNEDEVGVPYKRLSAWISISENDPQYRQSYSEPEIEYGLLTKDEAFDDDQDLKVNEAYEMMLSKIKHSINGVKSRGLFPHLIVHQQMSLYINLQSNGLDFEHFLLLHNKLKDIMIPGFVFEVSYSLMREDIYENIVKWRKQISIGKS